MTSALLAPLVLCLGMGLVIVADLIQPSAVRSYRLALTTVTLAFLSSLLALISPTTKSWAYLEAVLAFDPISQGFSALALFLAFLAFGMSRKSFAEEEQNAGEFYSLLLAATLGAVMVAHSKELLTFFIAFELLSIPLYIVTGFRRYNRESAEAGLKYFLSGALSSAIFLFGASWVFGAAGTTHFEKIVQGYEQGHRQPLIFGLMMITAAFAFKISAAPFHMWAPDTYEGAPIPVAAFLSSVPKTAMLAVMVRLFLAVTPVLEYEWMVVVSALAILSIVMGNLVALTQRELTRLAAYSGVAQIGYILIGIAALIGAHGAGNILLAKQALGGIYFYLVIYTVTNLAFWIILLTVSKARGSTRLDAFNGLSESSPLLAFAMLVCVLSLAGAPPTAGFVGKLYLFRSAFFTQPLMAIFGVVGSVISLYYYFNILRRCYFLKAPAKAEPIELSFSLKGLLAILLVLTFVGGLYPGIAQSCQTLAERMLIQ